MCDKKETLSQRSISGLYCIFRLHSILLAQIGESIMKLLFSGSVMILGLLSLSAFLPPPAPVPGQPGADLQQADTIVIQIVADADSVVAVPNSVMVAPGQVVTWQTDLGDWMVRFRSAQPFGEQAVGDGIRGNRGQRRGQAVRNEAADGAYKYDILVVVQGGGNLRADPEIVVKRGGLR